MIDGRGATPDVTPDQVHTLVARTDVVVRKGRFEALAIVTDSDFAFGMARMYQILTEPLPVQIGVFRTLDEATAWLAPRRRTSPNDGAPSSGASKAPRHAALGGGRGGHQLLQPGH